MKSRLASIHWLVWLSSGIMLLLALVALLDLTPWIRGGFGWRWEHNPAPLSRGLVLAGIVALYVAGGFWLMGRASSRLLLLWSLAGTIFISLAVTYAHFDDPFDILLARTLDSTSTGQHQAATQINWSSDEWQDWVGIMRASDGHIALSPPGSILWYGLMQSTLELVPGSEWMASPLIRAQCSNYAFLGLDPAEQASAWFGVLMPVWAALTIFPLYAAGKRLLDESAGRQVAFWWALVPTVTAFAGSWNTLFPLLAALAFWMLLRGMEAKGSRLALWCGASGVITGLALFTNFAFVPLPGVLGLYVLLHDWLEKRGHFTWQRPLVIGVCFAAGTLLPWLLYYIPSGQTPFDMLQAALDYHYDLDRPYWFWVWMHVWDWLMWTGVGLGLFALAGIGVWAFRRDEKPPSLGLAVFAVVLIVTLSGTPRGETARVWSFLSPLLLLAALVGLRGFNDSAVSYRLVTAAHALMALAIVASIPTMGSPLVEPPPLPPVQEQVRPTDAIFSLNNGDDLFRLTGWEAERAGESIGLRLRWQAERHIDDAYWFSALLVGPDGTITESVTWQPREFDGKQDRYPTTCWDQGQTIEDFALLPLPADSTGEWWISLAVFGDETAPEGRLLITLPDGSQDVQIGLGPVMVGG